LTKKLGVEKKKKKKTSSNTALPPTRRPKPTHKSPTAAGMRQCHRSAETKTSKTIDFQTVKYFLTTLNFLL
jgi:hypothetical protein